MDLDLSFANGNMTGSGSDNIGPFSIKGRYDPANQECYWTKSYLGAHDVFYRGFREGKGIWGTWEIGIFGRGGFHIWPLHSGESEEQITAAQREEPIEAGVSAPAPQPAIAPQDKHGAPPSGRQCRQLTLRPSHSSPRMGWSQRFRKTRNAGRKKSPGVLHYVEMPV